MDVLLTVVGIVIVIAVLYLILLAPGKLPKSANPRLWQAKYAHRGLHTKDKTVPENSMLAFSLAAEDGYGIELDVNLSSDGQVVVFHDDNLLRVCGVDKKITDCTYEELQTYRLCATGERIPLFTQVLELVAGRVPLIVELKATVHNGELCEKTAALLDAYGGPYCVESFHPGIVSWFRKNRPQSVRGQLSMGVKSYRGLSAAESFALSGLLTNISTRPHFAAYRHQDAHHKLRLFLYRMMGGKLVGWTVEDTDDIKWCLEYFDVIIFQFFKP